jgi:DNA-binding MarR family transcriptional regulator
MRTHIEELLWENRRLFRSLAAAADKALEPLGITAGQRALLEFLARERGAVSLSALARKRSVSRQHIHQTLNSLPDPAWVERLPDPADARSVLLRLSSQGAAFWKRVRAVDRVLIQRIQTSSDRKSVESATATLRTLRKLVEGERS